MRHAEYTRKKTFAEYRCQSPAGRRKFRCRPVRSNRTQDPDFAKVFSIERMLLGSWERFLPDDREMADGASSGQDSSCPIVLALAAGNDQQRLANGSEGGERGGDRSDDAFLLGQERLCARRRQRRVGRGVPPPIRAGKKAACRGWLEPSQTRCSRRCTTGGRARLGGAERRSHSDPVGR